LVTANLRFRGVNESWTQRATRRPTRPTETEWKLEYLEWKSWSFILVHRLSIDDASSYNNYRIASFLRKEFDHDYN